MTIVDLEPATTRLSDLVRSVPDDMLDAPTTCPGMSTGDLLDHISGLSLAFTAAATKDVAATSGRPPQPAAANLADDWRTSIPRQLGVLAQAWRDPEAWTGMTKAGGLDLPGEVAGVVALDEVVIHGWDLARSTGRPFECESHLLAAVHGFVAQFAGPGQAAAREGLFGPVVPVPDDAPLLDRVLGLTGRDPGWTAP
jgi:uncharacterized protein (TIGR03086 family)